MEICTAYKYPLDEDQKWAETYCEGKAFESFREQNAGHCGRMSVSLEYRETNQQLALASILRHSQDSAAVSI
jgi:hypothetical protein